MHARYLVRIWSGETELDNANSLAFDDIDGARDYAARLLATYHDPGDNEASSPSYAIYDRNEREYLPI